MQVTTQMEITLLLLIVEKECLESREYKFSIAIGRLTNVRMH